MAKVLFRMKGFAQADFGWPCGKTFIPNRAKCYTDPKTGKRLKVPVNYQTYQKIVGSKGKAAQTLYRDREQAIRDRRRAAVPGWKKQPEKPKQENKDKIKIFDKAISASTITKQLGNAYAYQAYRGGDKYDFDAVKNVPDKDLIDHWHWQRLANATVRYRTSYFPGATKAEMQKISQLGNDTYAQHLVKLLKHRGLLERAENSYNIDFPKIKADLEKKSNKLITSSTPKPDANKPVLNLDGKYQEPAPTSKESGKKLIKAEEVKSAADREAYATQELAEAKKSGDQSRIKSWEEQAKKARMAKLKTDQQSQKNTQTSLFNPLAYDKDLQGGLPLFKKRIKHRVEFARGGWQCGKTFIPYNRKCYTDPRTGIKTKTPITYKQYTKQRAQVYREAQQGKLPQNDYDRQLLQSVSDRQVKLKSQKEKLQLTQAAASVGARQVLPSGIAEVEVNKLQVDPKRFQYKILGAQTSTGSVGSLSGVKTWDANLAGIIQVWQDPKDKQVYVVNGHNRTERAKALGVKTMTAKFIKAKSPQEARSIGAMTNIAESKGSSLDAAKFFRDSGMTRQDLERKGIPMREKIATDGLALSNLSKPLFNRVVQGSLPEQRAVTIGQSLKDHKQQQELIDLIEKEEKRGKKINNDTIAELTDMVVGAPKVEQSQGGLFDLLGFTPETRSLALEKAQVQASIKRQLAREKKLFGTVGKSRAAEDLAKAGNQINVEESAEISETAAKALDAFDKEKNLSGNVSGAINRAAERIANGENSKKVEKEIYDEVLANLQKTYRFGEGSGTNIAKRRIRGDQLAASRQIKNAEFNQQPRLKRRLKRRNKFMKHCCCQVGATRL